MEAMESMLVRSTKDWHSVQMMKCLIYHQGNNPCVEYHMLCPSCWPDMDKQDCPRLLPDVVNCPQTICHIICIHMAGYLASPHMRLADCCAYCHCMLQHRSRPSQTQKGGTTCPTQQKDCAPWSKASSKMDQVVIALHAHVLRREQVPISSPVEHLKHPGGRIKWTHRLALTSMLPQVYNLRTTNIFGLKMLLDLPPFIHDLLLLVQPVCQV